MQMVDESGTSSTKSRTQRKRAATKREVNAIMERPCRTTLSAVTVGTRQGVEVPAESTQVAQGCCDYGTRRFGSMELRSGFARTMWQKVTKSMQWTESLLSRAR